MFSIQKPSRETILQFLEQQSKQPFTYDAVGATAGKLPADFAQDHERFKLGVPHERVFEKAKAALRDWEQFNLGWVEVLPAGVPIQKDAMIATVARSAGLWCLNTCRIIYVVEEAGPICRFGYAYGTLPGHVESGEERFWVEWNRASGEVWYDILVFSRPNHILARLTFPWVRLMQKKFRHDSAEAMLQAAGRD